MPTWPRWWRSWEIATGSPTAWRGSSAVAGVVLVAWLEGRPVGEVFLECEPANEPEVRRQLPGVPRLDHLEVAGLFQGRGIGTALIRAAEDSARQLGHEADRAWRGPGQPQGLAAV